MKFSQFEHIISPKRVERYLVATGHRKKKTMLLYNANLNLAKEMYVVINYFEVALRNAIDVCLQQSLGPDWLRDSVMQGGIFDKKHCEKMKKVISKRYQSLCNEGNYSHSKLLSSLEFGVWKYMFADFQYKVTGQKLLSIFPNKPKSSAAKQYDNTFIFNELNYINTLRNRIAHQEPICFSHKTRKIDTTYIHTQYERILRLFAMMGINSKQLLKDMDFVERACIVIETIL